MEVKKTIQDKDGKEKQVKVQMPSVEQILGAIKQRGMFAGIGRFQYIHYDIEQAMKIVEAIGKARNPKFVIDDENRFTYENFVKWCHCDPTMKALHPETGEVVNGRLMRGIYIAGNSGTGKSWCLEIMLAYCMAYGFKVQLVDKDPSPLWWRTVRADAICEHFAETGNVQEFKRQSILAIQDMGNEADETLYMGNRVDVVRQLINFRGDKVDEITLITSNYKMGGDVLLKRYGDKVVSRLQEMCNYFEIKGKDRRKL